MNTTKEKILVAIDGYRPLLKLMNQDIMGYSNDQIFNEYFDHRIYDITYVDKKDYNTKNKESITLKKGVWEKLPDVFKEILNDLALESEQYLSGCKQH